MGTRQPPLRGAAIVVADDHADSADLLEIVLAGAGADVRTAGSGQEVLDLLASWQPNALLLDITLPDMDGYALLTAIRALPEFKSTPAVAITGHAADSDKERSAEAGFAVHVIKPFDREALVHMIAQLVALKGDLVPSAVEAPAVRDVRRLVEEKGVHEALRFLNARTTHRFTGVYRFDGPMLRNVHLVDRLHPEVTRGDDAPLAETYCSRVGLERRLFVSSDTRCDDRLIGHPARATTQSYCGALLRNSDGTPFGSLCHFDVAPREIPSAEMDVLEQAAPVLARVVTAA